MEQYLAMGGYADFIWSAYAIVATVMAGLVLAVWRDLKRQRALLSALETGEGARRRAPARPSGTDR
jgi:heme exporter protein CcmD